MKVSATAPKGLGRFRKLFGRRPRGPAENDSRIIFGLDFGIVAVIVMACSVEELGQVRRRRLAEMETTFLRTEAMG